MKRGIETGYLRKVGAAQANRHDTRQVVRQVKRRQGDQSLEPGLKPGCDEERTVAILAAVDNPVADRDEFLA